MFSITDNERLRDAYALLMFMQRDISASAEKKAAVKNLAATVKMEIRAYNNRPVSNVRIWGSPVVAPTDSTRCHLVMSFRHSCGYVLRTW